MVPGHTEPSVLPDCWWSSRRTETIRPCCCRPPQPGVNRQKYILPICESTCDPLLLKGTSLTRCVLHHQLFNSLAILFGIGILSEPLAFSYAGWVGGTCLLIFYGWLTCYTYVSISRTPAIRQYADVLSAQQCKNPGEDHPRGPYRQILHADRCQSVWPKWQCIVLFSVLSRVVHYQVSRALFIDLDPLADCACSVVLVTIFSDSFHELVPVYSPDQYKLLGFFLCVQAFC